MNNYFPYPRSYECKYSHDVKDIDVIPIGGSFSTSRMILHE